MAFCVGITERGDAGRNLGWTETIKGVDCAILITKTITKNFAKAVLACEKPIIIHCTCTGWGGSELEPNVFPYWVQLNSLKHLIDAGFPPERCVLRIDPIIPAFGGIEAVERVLDYFERLHLNVNRIRISVIDDYRHVKERFKAAGYSTIYPGTNFYASAEQFTSVIEMLAKNQIGKVRFETCAEHQLVQMAERMGYKDLLIEQGCLSLTDLLLMGFKQFDLSSFSINPQHRSGCMCLSCKKELLAKRHPCENKCKYCFWKD